MEKEEEEECVTYEYDKYRMEFGMKCEFEDVPAKMIHQTRSTEISKKYRGQIPPLSSVVETSHVEPVYQVSWIQGHGDYVFVSASTDGRVMWWDSRRLSEPVDVKCLDVMKSEEGEEENVRIARYNLEDGFTHFASNG